MKTYKQVVNEFTKGSPDTSQSQVAGGFRKVRWESNTVNMDLGGGKYEKATDYLLNEHNVTNIVYDPYNRSSGHNKEAIKQCDDRAVTTTIFNVLNVIPEAKDRKKLLKFAKRKNTKTIYITVYEKNGDGIGLETTKGWQNNMKLSAYMDEIKSVFPSAKAKTGLVTIKV